MPLADSIHMRIKQMAPGMARGKQDWEPRYTSAARIFANKFVLRRIYPFPGIATPPQILSRLSLTDMRYRFSMIDFAIATRSLSDLGDRSEKIAGRGQILPGSQCQ